MSLKITRPNTKNFDQPLTTDYSNQFANFLAEHGLEPDPKKGLVADGSIGRAYINVGGQRKLVGWYQLWLDQASPFGRLGDYRVSADQPTAVWKPENRKRQVMIYPELHTRKHRGRLEIPLSDWRGHRLGLDSEVSETGLAWAPQQTVVSTRKASMTGKGSVSPCPESGCRILS